MTHHSGFLYVSRQGSFLDLFTCFLAGRVSVALQAFSSCGEQGLLLLATCGLLLAVALLLCSLALGTWASVVAGRSMGFSSWGMRDQYLWLIACSRFMAGGIFPDRGWSQFPLHWRVDSYPLYRHRSLAKEIFFKNHWWSHCPVVKADAKVKGFLCAGC